MITYEYPFNERIRTLLRLEDLFEKMTYFIEQEGVREHHVALVSLFEILEVAYRADLKVDLIQGLERQRQALMAFRNNPNISEKALSDALSEIEKSSAALSATGKTGQHLRENDWLMAIKSRAVIPGGLCEFDLPSYYYWLNQGVAVRQKALQNWFQPFLPLRDAFSIILRLLRASGTAESQLARNGNFQMMLGGSVAQMVRISLDQRLPCVPEISANRYALNIRFVPLNTDSRQHQTHDIADVPFDITFCNL